MKKIISIVLILSISLFVLSGCSKKDASSLEDKNFAELEYIEGQIVTILNNFAREEYRVDEKSKDTEINEDENTEDIHVVIPESPSIDWKKLLQDTKKIEKAVATTLVDLAALNIESGEIAKLSDGVNNMIIAIENQDESAFLIELNNVYSLIPTYIEKYASNSEKVFNKKIKYYTISTYIAYMDENQEMALNQVGELEKIYNEQMEDVGYVQQNEYNLNKIYILIQELKRAVEARSPELVKSKYLLLVQEI